MKKASSQFRFWVILGPTVFLATIMIYFLQLSLPFALIPFAAISSLFLCWRWKLVGLTFSIGLIGTALFYHYPSMTADERFWQVGLAMSFAIGCLITALCSEETEGLLKALEVESESRLEHLRRLDEKLRMSKKSAKHESDDLKNQISRAHHFSAEKEGKIMAQEEVIEILREELKALRDTFSFNEQGVDPAVLEEMKEKINTLSREKELLQTTLAKLQKELKQEAVRAITK